MNSVVRYIFIQVLLGLSTYGTAQNIWSGPPLIFEKADSANWLLAENQDQITDKVWITRQHNRGIFNILEESEFDRINRDSPEGTEWANGRISDGIENLVFSTWHASKQGPSAEIVGRDMVLHLIEEDIYIDIRFLSWTGGGGGSGTGFGGGFRYRRSTSTTNSQEEKLAQESLIVNQQNGQLHVKSSQRFATIRIWSVTGRTVWEGTDIHQTDFIISLQSVPSGMYVLQVDDRVAIRFIRPYRW